MGKRVKRGRECGDFYLSVGKYNYKLKRFYVLELMFLLAFQSLLGPSATYFPKDTIIFPNCPFIDMWLNIYFKKFFILIIWNKYPSC